MVPKNAGGAPFRERVIGAFVGAVVGDEMGSVVEGFPSWKVRQSFGWLSTILPTGSPTDETVMLFALTESMIEEEGFVPKSAAKGLLEAFREVDGRRFGKTTTLALTYYEKLGDWEAASLKAHEDLGGLTAGNGVLVRVLPLAVVYDGHELVEKAAISAKLTHYSDEAQAVCVFWALLLRRALLRTNLWEAYRETLEAFSELSPDLLYELSESSLKDANLEELAASGRALDTVKAVLKEALFGLSMGFKEKLEAMVNLGGDADSTAACMGELMGAVEGVSSIPIEWMASSKASPRARRLAERLLSVFAGR